MKISIYHHRLCYANVVTAAEAVKAIHYVLENNEVEPKELYASVISDPSEQAEADFALEIIKTELAALAKEFAAV